MSDINTNWTKDEFIAYLLLYAAKANYDESPEESKFIISKVGEEKYEKIHKEIESDLEYISIQKINFALDKFKLSNTDIDSILKEIKDLFWIDDTFDRLENSLLIKLQNLLHNS